MDLTFYGAARFVTGSCTLLSADNLNILIDCGMTQGADEKNVGPALPFKAESIDVLLLTHAHIDHSGRIPLLAKEGFRGTIYATGATTELAEIMLLDSAHIQESEAEWKTRKNLRSGKEKVEPLYTAQNAMDSLGLFSSCDYDKLYKISDGISFRFVDAGHLLGSASIELFVKEDGKTRKIVFSGDIGNFNQPIIKDPEYLESADYVVMESTYGDRLHEDVGPKQSLDDRARMLADIVNRTFRRGGNVVIPSFAVGRTQELLYLFRVIMDRKYCDFQIPVFVDSPLSVKATGIFQNAVRGDYYDEDARAMAERGINPINFPSLMTITDVADSKALNERVGSAVIISSSGMCDAGRIKHHLKHNLWRWESTVVFVGYQADGTLGRNLIDGAKHVTIFGEQIDVRAEITTLPGLSGHADQAGLIKWITAFKKKPEMVFVNHGEKTVAPFFASMLRKQYGFNALAPSFGDTFSLPLAKDMAEDNASYIPETEDDRRHYAEANLARNRDLLLSLVNRMIGESGSGEKAKSRRLNNAMNRLASDLEDLVNKWKGDV
jgi:Predicted exonuclease of the beta-lactamase fold involved in RNA processing